MDTFRLAATAHECGRLMSNQNLSKRKQINSNLRLDTED
jgi:hypothetical protein